jgi:hypothetical protein
MQAYSISEEFASGLFFSFLSTIDSIFGKISFKSFFCELKGQIYYTSVISDIVQ